VPTGEAVFFVPGAFAVADENEFVHGIRNFSGRELSARGNRMASRGGRMRGILC
jgi:hypothetical protein